MKVLMGIMVVVALLFGATDGFSIERYSIETFTATGIDMNDPTHQALDKCNDWLTGFQETHNVVGPADCNFLSTYCSRDYGPGTQCVALGYAKHEDGAACNGANKQLVKSFIGSASGNKEAKYRALNSVYAWGAEWSQKAALTSFRLGSCRSIDPDCYFPNTCKASCTGTIQFTQCE